MPIRVLHIIPTLVRGGAEKQLTLLATGLPRDEVDVHVCVLTHSGPYEQTLTDQGVPVTLIGKRWKVDPSALAKLNRLIQSLRPDVVQTWIFAANAYGRAAALAAGVKHIVASERCVDPWKGWYELAIDRYLARRSDKIITNSSGVMDFYIDHGIAADKFVVIPNGIEANEHQERGDRQQLLQELNLPADARLIGAVGRLWAQKRYKDLIWAAELLKAARDDVHLLIVGEGPERDRLRRFIEDVRVGDRVQLLGERDDVPRLLGHLDCFWLGSGYEGQSNALLEAMLAGVPAVVSDIPGNRDLIIDGQCGYLVAVGDAGQMARKTQSLLNDGDMARRLGQAARQRVETEFTVQKMVDRHAQLYRELVQQGN